MTATDNTVPDEPTLFSAVLTPYRSLGMTGFAAVMLLFGGISSITGLAFALAGAWPIMGFFGLDVLLVYWAFRANYRSGRAYEQVLVTPSELKIRKVSHRGEIAEWTLNPVWARIDREASEEYGIERLFLVSRGRRVSIAGFLSADEKASFATALGTALGEARRGPTRTLLA
ncbi:MAG TPA: DUF2244 domain-containing protein [Xanthobacteraceae bacterium]|nr:DUF2244 domain-containing protein [Xanthobacteraceae bacterium]